MNYVPKRRGRRPSLPPFLRSSPAPAQVSSKAPADVMALPHPDWIGQTVTFTGPAEQLKALKKAAAGSGLVPWVYHYERMEEDWFHWLAGPTHRMKISAARILSREMRDATWETHERAVAQADRSKACPFDLQALAPVPWEVLRLGPDDPASMRWMWENWATSWPLRRVEVAVDQPEKWSVRFFSADWTPWPVLRICGERWPGVSFNVATSYA